MVFTLASIALSLDPFLGSAGALWLIGWRVVQAFGGAMLMANSAAILTDAFPANKRGMALGVNQIAGISGQFIGLLLGGLLAAWDWRAVFWINVPIGIFGTSGPTSACARSPPPGGPASTGPGTSRSSSAPALLLAAITYGIQPYGGHPTGWTNPWVLAGLIGGVVLLVTFGIIETKIAEPMFRMSLFRIRAFAAGNAASLMGSIARGGLQFMLVIWLAGIWLPLHGYDYEVTPLWAGIYMLPLTAGFLIAGPISGALSDRYGPRPFATAGLLLAACAFTGLMLLPVNFPYWLFALIIFCNGDRLRPVRLAQHIGHHEQRPGQRPRRRVRDALHVPELRHVAVDRHLLLADDRRAGQHAAAHADQRARAQGVPAAIAAHIGSLPPVSTLFSALLGYNPVRGLLAPSGELARLPRHNVGVLTGKQFFPNLISGPFHHGLIIVFSAAVAMSVAGALISLLRGRQFYYDDAGAAAAAAPVPPARTVSSIPNANSSAGSPARRTDPAGAEGGA